MPPETELLDFWLSIDGRGDGTYEVAVRSPTGDARATVRLTGVVDDAVRIAASVSTQWRGLARGGTRGDAPAQLDTTVRDTGKRLFDAIMVERVLQRYRSSYDKATDRKQGLRLRLRIQAPELAALPWEYLYDPDHEHFIARTSFSSVVRYVEVDRKADSIRAELPLSVLGVISGPADQAPLAKDVERDRIERALRELIDAGRLHLHWTTDGTFSDFAQALRRHQPHIVHFIGHGDFDEASQEGLVFFEREDDTTNRVSASTLGEQLLGHQSVRLMVLNSCEGATSSAASLFSSTAGVLVRRGIPAVIAMQYPITDTAAVQFSQELYRGLADAEPVDRAVSAARLQMHAADPGSPEWGTPVLFLQSDTGALFEIAPTDTSSGEGESAGATMSGSTTPTHVEVPSRWSGFFSGVRKVVTVTRAIIVSTAMAVAFLVKAYFMARDERAKAVEDLDSRIAAIRLDTTRTGRAVAFNSLQLRVMPGQLEPYAIGKLVDLIREERPLSGGCTFDVGEKPPAINEFAVIRAQQRLAKRERQFSERVMDALIGAMAPNPVRPQSRIVLENVDLRRADLRHLELDSASFRGSCLVGARFDSSFLNAASFDNARLDSASFIDVTARRLSLNKAYLIDADFSGARLEHADLFGVMAHCAIFIGTHLDSARFEHAVAPWSSFEGASLSGVIRWEEIADLSMAYLTQASFGPNAPATVTSHRAGAAPLDIDRVSWINGRERALDPRGVCGRERAPEAGRRP